jgi:hypothetical protein
MYILDYEMPCNSKLTQKQKSSINLNESILSYICKDKNDEFADLQKF